MTQFMTSSSVHSAFVMNPKCCLFYCWSELSSGHLRVSVFGAQQAGRCHIIGFWNNGWICLSRAEVCFFVFFKSFVNVQLLLRSIIWLRTTFWSGSRWAAGVECRLVLKYFLSIYLRQNNNVLLWRFSSLTANLVNQRTQFTLWTNYGLKVGTLKLPYHYGRSQI